MFIGHYGPSFLAKRADHTIPLWVLFLAVQLLDVFWGVFVLLGVERLRIVSGFTETNPLDLYYMPYTHSLPGALGWALAGGICYGVVSKSVRGAVLVGGAVFSHWPLDFVVHVPDLALYDDTAKVGLGLWNYPAATLLLEGALVVVSLAAYMAATRSIGKLGRYGMPLLIGAVILMQVAMAFGPPPPSERAMAATALGSYALLAGVIAWLERHREAPSTT